MHKDKENLIRDLSSIKPSNPRLLNKLYSLSNLGLQERYIGKYANTRSIQQLAFKTWSNEKDLLDWISMVESSISATYESRQGPSISFLLSRVESNPCTTSLAHELRYEGWGSILEGVTMGADPEMTTLHRWESVPTEWRSRTILIQVDQYDNALYPPSKGKRSAYFGSNTQLRARKAPLQVMEIGSMVSSIKQLMELRGWMKNSPGLTHLIDKLIAEKTPEQMDKLLMYSRDVYGGTLSHRLDCPGLRRGAMLNQTANLTTHITILSDTATEYAKKGENFTICFQASFLRGISALTQLAYLGEDITGAWGLTFSCPACISSIPQESFSLESITYEGAPLPISIPELNPKIQVRRVGHHNNVVQDPVLSYSVIMARKFVLWEITTAQNDRITTMTNRDVEDIQTVTGFNLTEFSRVNVVSFLKSVIVYYGLFVNTYLDNPSLIWEKIATSSPEKTAFDALMDTITKCGLLPSLSSLTGSCSVETSLKSYIVLRRRLMESLITLLRSGLKTLIVEHPYLTQEDTVTSYHRLVCILLSVDGHLDQPPILSDSTKETICGWMKEQYDESADQYLPSIVSSEDFAISSIRSMVATPIILKGSIPRLKGLYLTPDTGESSKESYTWSPILNPTTLPLEIYWLLEFIDCNLAGRRVKRLITVNDKNGILFNALSHVVHPEEGYPIWKDDDPILCIDRGPLACALDSCTSRVKTSEWIGTMYKIPLVIEADMICFLPGDYSYSKDRVLCQHVVIPFNPVDIPDNYYSKKGILYTSNEPDGCYLYMDEKRQSSIHCEPVGVRHGSSSTGDSLERVAATYPPIVDPTCQDILKWMYAQFGRRVSSIRAAAQTARDLSYRELSLRRMKVSAAFVVGQSERLEARVRRLEQLDDAEHHLLAYHGWQGVARLAESGPDLSFSYTKTVHTHDVSFAHLCLTKRCAMSPVKVFHLEWSRTPFFQYTVRWIQAFYILSRSVEHKDDDSRKRKRRI